MTKIEWNNWDEEELVLLTPKLMEIGANQKGNQDSAVFQFNQYCRHSILFNFTLKGFIGMPSSPEQAMGIAHYCPGYDGSEESKDKLWERRFDQVISIAVATPQDSAWTPSGIIEMCDFYGKTFSEVWEKASEMHREKYKASIPKAGRNKIERHFDYCQERLDGLVSVLK